MTAPANLDELADRLDVAVRSLMETPTLVQARALANECDITRLRAAMRDAPDVLGNALAAKRQADEAVRVASERLAAARTDAEWELDARFEVQGNKTYLIVSEGDGEEGRKAMTADERKAWKAQVAEKVPAVAAARKALLEAEHGQAAARDRVTVAERSLSAIKAELNASVELLATLRLAIAPAGRN